jgi:hypothetical protein
VRVNVHAVGIVSSIGNSDVFRRLQALSTVVQMDHWDGESLLAIGRHFVQQWPLEITVQGPETLVRVVRNVHNRARDIVPRSTASTSLLASSLFSQYLTDLRRITVEKHVDLTSQIRSLQAALATVHQAQITVTDMRHQLEMLEPQLQRAKAEALHVQSQVIEDRIITRDLVQQIEKEEALSNENKQKMQRLAGAFCALPVAFVCDVVF